MKGRQINSPDSRGGSIFIRDGYGTPEPTMTLDLSEIYIPGLSLVLIERVFE